MKNQAGLPSFHTDNANSSEKIEFAAVQQATPAMQQYLAGFGQWVTVIQGVIFVICVLTLRRGVIGEIAHYFRRSL